jgi:hypothetical protein
MRTKQQEIVQRADGLFMLADQPELRLAQARRQVAVLTLSLLPAPSPANSSRKIPATEPAEKLLIRIRHSHRLS